MKNKVKNYFNKTAIFFMILCLIGGQLTLPSFAESGGDIGIKDSSGQIATVASSVGNGGNGGQIAPAAVSEGTEGTGSSGGGGNSGGSGIGTAAAASEEIGNVRVQILSETLARIELKGPGGYEDRLSYHIVKRDWPGAAAVKITDANNTVISTMAYNVVVPNGATSLTGVYVTDRNGREIWRYTSLPTGSPYLPDPGATPKAWAIADNPRVISAEWGYKPMPADNTRFTDYNGWDSTNNSPDMFIFVPGGDSKQLRKDFNDLTGQSELIPLKSLGLWYSRYYAFSETTALDMIDKFHAERFPLDYFVVDTDWRISASVGYAVNTTLFPDMPRFIQRAHDKNVQIMFNDHPEPRNGHQSLAQDELQYRTDSLRSIFDMGLDVWWYDRNWSTALVSPFNGIPKESFGMYLYREITKNYWEDKKGTSLYARRPLIMGNVDGIDNGVFNRAPNLSSHRYSIQWTGDTHGQPVDLRQELVDAVKSGAVTATPYVSADISGHMDVLQPDQWLRWTQFAALSPIIRYHCTAGSNLDRAPWLYGANAENVARDYIDMRYRLLPLFYSLSHENYETGLPLLRRLDFNYPGYGEAQDNTQYTLGDNILVAPIWESPSATNIAPAAWLSHDGQQGLQAEYFNNLTLSGTPVLSRVDDQVNFDWGNGSPAAAVNGDNFSARWTGSITIGSGDVKLAATSDDGVRVWIDDQLVIDNWNDSNNVTTVGETIFASGSTHSIKIEYFERGGGAVMRLQYVDLSANVNSRSVFIPDGRWIDVWTGAEYVGPRTITAVHGTNTSPIFVRSGSIIPLAENVSYIGEKKWETIGLDVYPSVMLSGTAQLYEDDGDSVAYKDGKFRTTDLLTTASGGDILVKIGAAAGSYSGDNLVNNRNWKVRVHAPADWGTLLSAKLDGADVQAVKLTKNAQGFPFAISGASPDADVYEITISNAGVTSSHEIRLNFEHPVAETLPSYSDTPIDFSAEDAMAPSTVNLTQTGEYDWAHFGTDGLNSKTLKNNISERSIGDIKTGNQQSVLSQRLSEFIWTDGNGSPSARNGITNGLAIGDGSFDLDVKVGTDTERINLYIGGNNASGRLTISDGTKNGAPAMFDISNLSGSFVRKIKITASAETAANLRIKYTKTGGSGQIAVFAVTVSSPEADKEIAIQRYATLESISGAVDISAGGAADWMHFGAGGDINAVNRKSGVEKRLLTEPQLINGASKIIVNDFNQPGGLSFTGGEPRASLTGSQNGIHSYEGAYEITVPSTDTWRTLRVWLGCWNSTSRIEVYDDAGLELTKFDFTAGSTVAYRCLYITYRSEEESSLHIKMSRAGGSGNFSLGAYAIYENGPGADYAVMSLDEVPAALNFTAPDFHDWAHFGYQAATRFNHKSGTPGIIGNPSQILSGTALNRGNDFRTVFSWSDGSVNQTVNNTRDFSYTPDGAKLSYSIPAGNWKISLYTSAWWTDAYFEMWDETGKIIGVDRYQSKIATSGSSEYRKADLYYSSDAPHTVTVRMTPVLAFDNHMGNMGLAGVTVEKCVNHVDIVGDEAPDIRNGITARVYASPGSDLELASYEGVSFQWQKSDRSDGTFTDISGATSRDYRPVLADAGSYLRIAASYDGKTVYGVTDKPVSDLIFDPVFTSPRGEVLDHFSGNQALVSLDYYNPLDREVSLTMVVAVYGENGKLQYTNTVTRDFAPDSVEGFDLTLNLPAAVTEASYAQVFVWDQNFIPARKAARFN